MLHILLLGTQKREKPTTSKNLDPTRRDRRTGGDGDERCLKCVDFYRAEKRGCTRKGVRHVRTLRAVYRSTLPAIGRVVTEKNL